MLSSTQITCIDRNKVTNKVAAIRALRGLLSLPLKDAKDAIEHVMDHPGDTHVIPTGVQGEPDVRVMEFLNDLEGQGIMTSVNSPINDIRIQLVDLIKDATDAECYGLASDIAQVCDKYFGLSTAYIRGETDNGDIRS